MPIDRSKAPLAALTMVHEEDFFLERWVSYWRRFLPDDAIYVLNHGGNADVARIAGLIAEATALVQQQSQEN